MRALLWAGLLASSVWAGPAFEVRATDARTGAALTGVKCALVVPGAKSAYATFGAAYSGKRLPAPGDLLYVYHRGHDLKRVPMTGKDVLVAVALDPVTSWAELRVDKALEQTAWTAHIRIQPEGRWKTPPIEDQCKYYVRGPKKRIPLAGGTVASAYVFAEQGVIWPMAVWLPPGRVTSVKYEPPRVLALQVDGTFDPHRATYLPDLLWTPPGPPLRVDAWRWAVNKPWWLEEGVRDKGRKLLVAPDCPFHVFAQGSDGGAVYRHVTPTSAAIDLRGPARLKSVPQRPRLGASPVPAGTLLAPGRLDLASITSIRDLGLERCVAKLGEGWQPIELPDAEWLTSWHVDSGLGHFRWLADAPPRADPYPGELLLRVREPRQLRGYASVFQVWKGSGKVRTAPSDKALRKHVDGESAIRFRGLPPGSYGLDIRVVIEGPGGAPVRVGRMANAFIGKDSPKVVIDLDAP